MDYLFGKKSTQTASIEQQIEKLRAFVNQRCDQSLQQLQGSGQTERS